MAEGSGEGIWGGLGGWGGVSGGLGWVASLRRPDSCELDGANVDESFTKAEDADLVSFILDHNPVRHIVPSDGMPAAPVLNPSSITAPATRRIPSQTNPDIGGSVAPCIGAAPLCGQAQAQRESEDATLMFRGWVELGPNQGR